ncbi:MAG: hypothetical protein HQ580_03625 [Planctomycetes bacterium]|nr:hypothetical protein [Planctomycetota bacterium]
MEQTFAATEINVGFHPEGFRIDKTASPMNRYTKWEILPGKKWRNPEPVCFDTLPKEGWFAKDRFDWNKPNNTEVYA